jgi:hypothetical protein
MPCPYCMSLTDGVACTLHFNVKLLKKCNIILMCFAVGVEVSFRYHVLFPFIELKCAKVLLIFVFFVTIFGSFHCLPHILLNLN